MARAIDLNSDLGESFGPWVMGDDASMLALVSSANVACGGHASDPETMFATLSEAARRGVVVGAHPGYADREGFGRRVIPMRETEIERMAASSPIVQGPKLSPRSELRSIARAMRCRLRAEKRFAVGRRGESAV